MNHRPVDQSTKQQLNAYLTKVEGYFSADGIAIISNIAYGLEGLLKKAIEQFTKAQKKCFVILDTLGGTVEVAERIVNLIRYHYEEVYFIVPDRAMSAGTILAMSGDKIYMDYFSVLGPIDPQFEKDGKLIPGLSYLIQYQRLLDKANNGQLNTAEYALLSKLDLAELHQYEQAKDLSIELLEKWLSQYKFKDWTTHSSTNKPVTDDEKRARANEIGKALNDNVRWRTHNRGIPRDVLTNEVRVRIDKLEDLKEVHKQIADYFDLLKDHMGRMEYAYFIHTRDFF